MQPNQQQPAPPENPPTQSPVMDVVPPPRAATSPQQPSSPETPAEQPKPAKPEVPKQPKVHRNGVGLAVAATVIITLALAALFTYAYLRTSGVAGF